MTFSRLALLAGLAVLLAACTDAAEGSPPAPASLESEQKTATSTKTGASVGDEHGFTDDFRAFLAKRAPAIDFVREDLEGASSFGGKVSPADKVSRQPVVFIHGNSDRGVGGKLGGWNTSLEYFLAHGYSSAEVYTFTWGEANPLTAARQYHSREYLVRIRTFLEAVLAYTGAKKLDVLGHSMGVTLGRKAILGGAASDLLGGGRYDLGAPLTAQIDTFVGIAGANLGITSCWFTGPITPTCAATNGFYPGTKTFTGRVAGRSAFLDDLDDHPHSEGAHTFSIWTPGDEILGTSARVWGEVTSRLPEQDGEIELDRSFGHMDAKSATAEAQLRLVVQHTP